MSLPTPADHLPAIDHLVVAARSLPEGAAWLQERLGVAAGPVGLHPHFGTHNHLWSLGSCYLEVIAIDPQASAPPYPRWFGLDESAMQRRLESGPQLIHWVAHSHAAPLPAQGSPLALARGPYRWTLTVPANGSLPAGGLLPSLIVWEGPSPLASLPDEGLKLEGLALESPQPEALRRDLEALGLAGLVRVQAGPAPRLRARIHTAAGRVEL